MELPLWGGARRTAISDTCRSRLSRRSTIAPTMSRPPPFGRYRKRRTELVAAEVFSATRPMSNQKLKMDIARLKADLAEHRYVFFAAPGYAAGRHEVLETDPRIKVYAVDP